jgi:hypothetical protein
MAGCGVRKQGDIFYEMFGQEPPADVVFLKTEAKSSNVFGIIRDYERMHLSFRCPRTAFEDLMSSSEGFTRTVEDTNYWFRSWGTGDLLIVRYDPALEVATADVEAHH